MPENSMRDWIIRILIWLLVSALFSIVLRDGFYGYLKRLAVVLPCCAVLSWLLDLILESIHA